LNGRIGRTGLPGDYLVKLWTAALVAAAAGWTIRRFYGQHSPILLAGMVLIPYGMIYFAATALLGVSESRSSIGRILDLLRRPGLSGSGRGLGGS
jgi:hypothetical protein